MSSRAAQAAALLVSLAGAAGCGASPPPDMLIEARRAYRSAADSPGSNLAPVELEEARQALDRAEAFFGDDPDGRPTIDEAYIALRKAERALARGAEEVARRELDDHRDEQERLEAEYLRRTQQRLRVTQGQLEEERRRLAERTEDLETSQEQLEARSEELQSERAARERAEQEAAAAIESLRRVAQVQEEQRGLVITLSGAVLFSSGSAELLPLAQQKLSQVAETLNDHEGRTILVEGHTDSRGSDRTNQRLSQERADSVRTYLVSQGVEADRIRARGLGESRPIADNRTPDGRANNRRVEIVVEPLQ